MNIFKIPLHNGVLLLVGIVACGNLQAEENKKQPVIDSQGNLFSNTSSETDGVTLQKSESATHLYGGIGLTASSVNSDFKMDYEVDEDDFLEAIPHVQHKGRSLKKIGVSIVGGIRADLSSNLFLATECNFSHGTTTHWRDFTQSEDVEFGNLGKEYDSQKISHINIKHKGEIGLFLKAGTIVQSYEFYGIWGVSTKRIEIEYELDSNAQDIKQAYSDCFSRRIYAPVLGVGITKEITNNISGSFEYRYKMYNLAKGNLAKVGDKVFEGDDVHHDRSLRHVEIDSNKHELSLSITVRTKL